jgi:hypothetical protein
MSLNSLFGNMPATVTRTWKPQIKLSGDHVGYAIAGPTVSPFYDPRQIKELKKKLGITLDNTKGLLIEKQFGKKFGY